jgi:CheY-like chemotaxis protein
MEQSPVRFADQRTILVVDDDPGILEAVRAILAKGDHYTILVATEGADGLDQSINFKGDIHLLLSDFQMPGMSGVELATLMNRSTTRTQGAANVCIPRWNARAQ